MDPVHTSPVSHKGWKIFFNVAYSLLLIFSLFGTFFMVMGGWAMAFDADPQGLKLVLMVVALAMYAVSPVCLVVSLFLLNRRSLTWAWLGAAPFLIIILSGLLG